MNISDSIKTVLSAQTMKERAGIIREEIAVSIWKRQNYKAFMALNPELGPQPIDIYLDDTRYEQEKPADKEIAGMIRRMGGEPSKCLLEKVELRRRLKENDFATEEQREKAQVRSAVIDILDGKEEITFGCCEQENGGGAGSMAGAHG